MGVADKSTHELALRCHRHLSPSPKKVRAELADFPSRLFAETRQLSTHPPAARCSTHTYVFKVVMHSGQEPQLAGAQSCCRSQPCQEKTASSFNSNQREDFKTRLRKKVRVDDEAQRNRSHLCYSIGSPDTVDRSHSSRPHRAGSFRRLFWSWQLAQA